MEPEQHHVCQCDECGEKETSEYATVLCRKCFGAFRRAQTRCEIEDMIVRHFGTYATAGAAADFAKALCKHWYEGGDE